MKRVEFIECRFPWNESRGERIFHHECGMRRDHDGPHLCNYCDEEKQR